MRRIVFVGLAAAVGAASAVFALAAPAGAAPASGSFTISPTSGPLTSTTATSSTPCPAAATTAEVFISSVDRPPGSPPAGGFGGPHPVLTLGASKSWTTPVSVNIGSSNAPVGSVIHIGAECKDASATVLVEYTTQPYTVTAPTTPPTTACVPGSGSGSGSGAVVCPATTVSPNLFALSPTSPLALTGETVAVPLAGAAGLMILVLGARQLRRRTNS